MMVFIVLSICISLDVFVWMLERGATTDQITIQKVLKEALTISLCNVVFFILGHFISVFVFGEKMLRFNKFFAIVIFMLLGNAMFVQAFRKKKFEERLKKMPMKDIIRFALFASIDCFFVGMGSYYLSIHYVYEIICLFLIIFIGSVIHYYFGYYNGAGYQRVYYCLCAVIYIIMSLNLIFHLI